MSYKRELRIKNYTKVFDEMLGILFLMDFGLTTNISVLPKLRRRKIWAIHSFMSLRQASIVDCFAMVSGLADMYS